MDARNDIVRVWQTFVNEFLSRCGRRAASEAWRQSGSAAVDQGIHCSWTGEGFMHSVGAEGRYEVIQIAAPTQSY
jgi:hypothetical protein